MNRIEKIASKVAAGIRSKPTFTEYGFDLTDFGNAKNFMNVLAAAGIASQQEPERGHIGEFIWEGSGIVIVTGNNPITGEYIQSERRKSEVGYASYIGIEGNPEKVAAVVRAVKRYAMALGEESPGKRSFI